MARKKKGEIDESPPEVEVSVIEKMSAEITTLKKQNAGLKGEISRLKKMIVAFENKIKDLNQEYNDLDAIYNNASEELIQLKRLAARPWYKRIFG